MKTILEKICVAKRNELNARKALYPVSLLEKSHFFETEIVSLVSYLRREDKLGVIAEIKRQSPSKGILNEHIDVEQLSIGYMQAGASALSVLTDEAFFGGQNRDLECARRFNFCPILRKDFILDEYQVIESKSIGADAILLIAACLEKKECHALAKAARDLGLEVVLEVHEEAELDYISDHVSVVGVNNRNLQTFDVSLDTSRQLAAKIPGSMTKISESGISTPEAILELLASGFNGFLIGEAFMKHARPERVCEKLIRAVEKRQPNRAA